MTTRHPGFADSRLMVPPDCCANSDTTHDPRPSCSSSGHPIPLSSTMTTRRVGSRWSLTWCSPGNACFKALVASRGLSAAELMQKRAAEEAARKEALHAIERWNAERSPLWSPTIRCAVVAGTPWLDVYCPGCRTSRAIDIRTLDRHPLASVGSLLLGLRCSWCPGNAPMPVSPGCTRCRRPRGGAKVCQWNSCTAALSAQRTSK